MEFISYVFKSHQNVSFEFHMRLLERRSLRLSLSSSIPHVPIHTHIVFCVCIFLCAYLVFLIVISQFVVIYVTWIASSKRNPIVCYYKQHHRRQTTDDKINNTESFSKTFHFHYYCCEVSPYYDENVFDFILLIYVQRFC